MQSGIASCELCQAPLYMKYIEVVSSGLGMHMCRFHSLVLIHQDTKTCARLLKHMICTVYADDSLWPYSYI